jgi:glycosyltransferase involved in cell wall biosynthesis
MAILLVITRGEAGGAQVHVLELLRGFIGREKLVLAVGDDEFLSKEARQIGVDVRVVPSLQREVAGAGDLHAWRALRALIREVQPRLVHTHSSKAGILGRLAARAEGVPCIHTAHAWSFSDGLPLRRKLLAVPVEAAVGRVTDRFIVVSEADGEVGTRWRVARPCQVRVVHNGVADHPLRATPDAPGVPIFTMVARHAPPKDHALLVEALAGLGVPARVQFVGDGPDRAALEALVASRGLRESVAFLGTRTDVAELLAASHGAVLASKQEGFPLVVLEAMRHGLPVLASDVGGIREAVESEVTGLLVPRGDVEGWRRALRRLVASPGTRRRWGDAGRRVFEARFSAPAMVERTWEVYVETSRKVGPGYQAAGADAEVSNVAPGSTS